MANLTVKELKEKIQNLPDNMVIDESVLKQFHQKLDSSVIKNKYIHIYLDIYHPVYDSVEDYEDEFEDIIDHCKSEKDFIQRWYVDCDYIEDYLDQIKYELVDDKK